MAEVEEADQRKVIAALDSQPWEELALKLKCEMVISLTPFSWCTDRPRNSRTM